MGEPGGSAATDVDIVRAGARGDVLRAGSAGGVQGRRAARVLAGILRRTGRTTGGGGGRGGDGVVLQLRAVVRRAGGARGVGTDFAGRGAAGAERGSGGGAA